MKAQNTTYAILVTVTMFSNSGVSLSTIDGKYAILKSKFCEQSIGVLKSVSIDISGAEAELKARIECKSDELLKRCLKDFQNTTFSDLLSTSVKTISVVGVEIHSEEVSVELFKMNYSLEPYSRVTS